MCRSSYILLGRGSTLAGSALVVLSIAAFVPLIRRLEPFSWASFLGDCHFTVFPFFFVPGVVFFLAGARLDHLWWPATPFVQGASFGIAAIMFIATCSIVVLDASRACLALPKGPVFEGIWAILSKTDKAWNAMAALATCSFGAYVVNLALRRPPRDDVAFRRLLIAYALFCTWFPLRVVSIYVDYRSQTSSKVSEYFAFLTALAAAILLAFLFLLVRWSSADKEVRKAMRWLSGLMAFVPLAVLCERLDPNGYLRRFLTIPGAVIVIALVQVVLWKVRQVGDDMSVSDEQVSPPPLRDSAPPRP